MSKKSKAPPPPDYAGAAKATSEGNIEAARIAANANRLDQYTPYGNMIYTPIEGSAINPTTGAADPNFQRYQITQNLSPDQQRILEANQRLDYGLLDTAEIGLGKARGLLENPEVDFSGLPQAIGGEGAQAAIMSRLQPQLDRQREALRTQLLNQGIGMGNQAYRGAFDDQDRRENDLLTAAAIQGINLDQQARQQGIAERTYQQDRPLNLINALRMGNQVTSPTWVNPPQQATTQGPDMLGATNALSGYQTDLYNQKQASQNNTMNGLFTLGAAALPLMFSDRRLKSNIVRVGEHPLGISIYEYDIFGRRERGVMADEIEHVIPEAVVTHPSGYKMVNYGML